VSDGDHGAEAGLGKKPDEDPWLIADLPSVVDSKGRIVVCLYATSLAFSGHQIDGWRKFVV